MFWSKQRTLGGFALLFLGAALLLGCPQVRTKRAKSLGIWSPVTSFERQALRDLQGSKTPETHLRMALVLSGVRTAEQAAPLIARYRTFLAGIRPKVNALSGPKERGKLLLETMHVQLLGTTLKPYKTRYTKSQTRLDTLLRKGTFNCVSSAVLYTLLALEFGFRVQGVELPEHQFLQISHPQMTETVEVETTSATGYAQKHDEAFYKKQAQRTQGPRFDNALTYQDYLKRKFVSTEEVIGQLSLVQHTHPGTMTELDRRRIHELAGSLFFTPAIQTNRVSAWLGYMKEYRKQEKWKALTQVFATTETHLSKLHAYTAKAPGVLNNLTLYHMMQAEALLRLQRTETLSKRVQQGLHFYKQSVDKGKTNPKTGKYVNALLHHVLHGLRAKGDAGGSLLALIKRDFPQWYPSLQGRLRSSRGIDVLNQGNRLLRRGKWREALKAFNTCLQSATGKLKAACEQNRKTTHYNWAVIATRRKDYATARQQVTQCLRYTPPHAGCQKIQAWLTRQGF